MLIRLHHNVVNNLLALLAILAAIFMVTSCMEGKRRHELEMNIQKTLSQTSPPALTAPSSSDL